MAAAGYLLVPFACIRDNHRQAVMLGRPNETSVHMIAPGFLGSRMLITHGWP